MKKIATDNYNWGWIFWTSCAVIRKPFPGWKTWRERGLSARAESCEMQLCGFDEKGPQRPGLSTALSQRRGCPRRRECGRLGRRASCLFVAQVHFRPAACKYWLPPFSSFLTHGPDPFPSFAASLFFFLPVLSSLATMRWRWLCWWCDSEGENSQSKLNMKCNTTAGLTWKILFLCRTTVFRDIYVTQYFR